MILYTSEVRNDQVVYVANNSSIGTLSIFGFFGVFSKGVHLLALPASFEAKPILVDELSSVLWMYARVSQQIAIIKRIFFPRHQRGSLSDSESTTIHDQPGILFNLTSCQCAN